MPLKNREVAGSTPAPTTQNTGAEQGFVPACGSRLGQQDAQGRKKTRPGGSHHSAARPCEHGGTAISSPVSARSGPVYSWLPGALCAAPEGGQADG
jgi:hypothetical protein